MHKFATFEREELWKLRERADYFASLKGTNHNWVDAYRQLENAADRLDAMIARCSGGPFPIIENAPVQMELPFVENLHIATILGESHLNSTSTPTQEGK